MPPSSCPFILETLPLGGVQPELAHAARGLKAGWAKGFPIKVPL